MLTFCQSALSDITTVTAASQYGASYQHSTGNDKDISISYT